jgi:hypothetical protein
MITQPLNVLGIILRKSGGGGDVSLSPELLDDELTFYQYFRTSRFQFDMMH